MHSQNATFVLPSRIRPGDRVPRGRGPWAIVQEVHKAKGRPPVAGPNLEITTNRGKLVVPAEQHLRVIRS